MKKTIIRYSSIAFISVLLFSSSAKDPEIREKTDNDTFPGPPEERNLRRKYKIQEALSRIASIFAYPEDIDMAIDEALRGVGELCNASRSYLFLFHEEEAIMDNTHEWCAEDVEPQMQNLQNLPMEMFPWWCSKLREGELIHIKDVSSLPVEASAEKKTFEQHGIRSILSLPVIIEGKLKGFIGLDNVKETGEWEPEDIDSLFTVSNLMTIALKSERMEKEMMLAKFSVDHSDTPTFWFDDECQLFNANQAGCNLLGYSCEELLRMRMCDIDVSGKDMLGEIKSKGSLNFESVFRKKDNTEFPVEIFIDHLNFKDEECYFCFVKDISKRKVMENSLRERAEHLMNIIDLSPIPTMIASDDRAILHLNKSFIETFQYDLNDIPDIEHWFRHSLQSEEEREKARKSCASTMEQRVPGVNPYEWKVHRKNGKAMVVDVRYSAVENEHIFMFHDLTRQKKIEDILRLNESRLEALLELNRKKSLSCNEIADFALEKGVELTQSRIGYIAFLEEEEAVLTIDSWSEEVGRVCRTKECPKIFLLKDTGLWGEVVRQRKAIVLNDYASPSPLKKGYPERHVELKRTLNVPIFDGDIIVGVAGVANKESDYDQSDIHQLMLLMEGMWEIIEHIRSDEKLRNSTLELAKLNEELRQLNDEMKYVDEIKNNFLANVSHELRTPLMPIVGYSGLLSEEYFGELNNKQKEILKTVIRNSEHLKRLIDSLLYLNSLQTKEFNYERDALQLSEVIDKAISIISIENSDSGKSVNVEIPGTLPLIYADKDYIAELFIHLLNNAFKFTPDDGIITIYSEEDREFVHITIADNGVGINKEKLAKIFDVFFQGDSSKTRKYGGTGIGLHMCKKIVEDHGGEIRIESEEGSGTAVHLKFPIYTEAE
ncbi:MAG: GAF domain-containing protein [Methanolobus sp.]|nr:GAF domain-containing protein [Methanolobus sp.]